MPGHFFQERIEATPDELAAELSQGLPKVIHNVNRGRSITSRLLSFSRKSEVSAQGADIGASLEEILPLLEKRAKLAQVTIHCSATITRVHAAQR